MTPAERTLLLAVAKTVRDKAMLGLGQKFSHALDHLIAAVEAEAPTEALPIPPPSGPDRTGEKSCATCDHDDDGECTAPLDAECFVPDLALWQPKPSGKDCPSYTHCDRSECEPHEIDGEAFLAGVDCQGPNGSAATSEPEKSCRTCRHLSDDLCSLHVSKTEACIGTFANWQPKASEPEKSCRTCAHKNQDSGEPYTETCLKCHIADNHMMWQPKPSECPTCEGLGKVNDMNAARLIKISCPDCGGTGRK